MRRYILLVGLLTLLVGATTSLVSYMVVTWDLQNGVGFSAMIVENKYAYSTGELTQVNEMQYAAKRDGSDVLVQNIPAPDGTLKDRRQILDIPARRRLTVDAMTESLTTVYISEDAATSQLLRRTACATATSEGEAERKTFLGYETVRVETSLSKEDEPRAEKIVAWLAPALDCYPLRLTLVRADSAGRFRVLVSREVTSVEIGDPDISLFESPASYEERSFSQMAAEFVRRYPNMHTAVATPGMQETLRRWDEVYFGSRNGKVNMPTE